MAIEGKTNSLARGLWVSVTEMLLILIWIILWGFMAMLMTKPPTRCLIIESSLAKITEYGSGWGSLEEWWRISPAAVTAVIITDFGSRTKGEE